MLAKCVNPVCSKPLHYLRDGRVFHVERGNPANGGKQSHNVEHFWLCGECSREMTVLFDEQEGVRVVRRWDRRGSRVA